MIQFAIALVFVSITITTQAQQNKLNWSAAEYSGSRTSKDVRTAMASKGFAWLSGSPVDNEKLSIGKNAQFFGFVALRYQSGRAANRGALGRAFFGLTRPEQRAFLSNAVLAEAEPLADWWSKRKEILGVYENHLYTSEPIDERALLALGIEFSRLNATVALHEARAFAALEDSLTDSQWAQLRAWRKDPEHARKTDQQNRVTAYGLNRDQLKQLEDLYAKAFSWITGAPKDNEIIPLGQPAQFFGFVAIRHKSGHAASRGQISKAFLDILGREQRAVIDQAVKAQLPVVKQFLQQRHLFLQELNLLRTGPGSFSEDRAMALAEEMGKLEIQVGSIEATAYRKIRQSMTETQVAQMMKLRGEYVLDSAQVATLTDDERGAQLAILCVGCHGTPGQYRAGMVGPPLEGLFDRPIASKTGYEYSESLQTTGAAKPWTNESLDQFLEAPRKFAGGTKMEFQGLLKAEDRQSLIRYLREKY